LKVNILISLAKHAQKVIDGYQYPEPMHLTLQQYFKANKQLGSRDRRTIRNLLYSWLRLGKSLQHIEENAMLIAFALLNDDKENFQAITNEPFPEDIKAWLIAKNKENALDLLYPFCSEVSKEINLDGFVWSHLTQPALWMWSKRSNKIKEYLMNNKVDIISFADDEFALCLPNGFDLAILPDELKNSANVQDISSQMLCRKIELNGSDKIWDCCAASGGKSLKLKSISGDFDLYVSDLRSTSIFNLHKRFKHNFIKKYHYATIDLSNELKSVAFKNNDRVEVPVSANYFDTIVLDAPCSGSGTWSRTPEHMLNFDINTLAEIQTKQLAIVKNAWPFLKKGGKLYYMTCSAFAKENEEVISQLKISDFKLNFQNYFEGYNHSGDTMFMACLEKMTN
jgi:16S rRNA (cytosine967-C5)-methyltransferase